MQLASIPHNQCVDTERHCNTTFRETQILNDIIMSARPPCNNRGSRLAVGVHLEHKTVTVCRCSSENHRAGKAVARCPHLRVCTHIIYRGQTTLLAACQRQVENSIAKDLCEHLHVRRCKVAGLFHEAQVVTVARFLTQQQLSLPGAAGQQASRRRRGHGRPQGGNRRGQ